MAQRAKSPTVPSIQEIASAPGSSSSAARPAVRPDRRGRPAAGRHAGGGVAIEGRPGDHGRHLHHRLVVSQQLAQHRLHRAGELTQLAAEHGTTIRSLVEDLAQSTPTQTEYAERAELARAELASALGSAPSPEAEAKAKALLERLGGAAHGPRAAA
ncbi:hypothetical protein ABZ478_37350 [Streptomyces sp. NPDC005706]|uniref:hypothetical protein n=1 Tax=Streptomyces sp. NPDC005706 TaxID=3157169 RepID=UPI0033D57D4D